MRGTPEERFWAKVEKTETCWLWTGATSSWGYGNFYVDGKYLKAHRWAYENFVGPIPEGLDLDHLCRVRHCVRPTHLEPATRRENLKRGEVPWGAWQLARTHCPQGHPYSGENLYTYPDGRRACRTCALDAKHRYRKRLADVSD